MTARWLWERVLTPTERDRLGGEFEAAYTGSGVTAGMWMRLHGVTLPQAVVAVAVRCRLLDPDTGQALLREFGETPADPDEAVAHAVAAGGLVLTEFPRQAWWNGVQIPIGWAARDRPWALLSELAKQSKAGGTVDWMSLDSGDITDHKYVTKARSRLVGLAGFPPDLARAIESAGRGSYRLVIPPERIRVFVRAAGDLLREWTP